MGVVVADPRLERGARILPLRMWSPWDGRLLRVTGCVMWGEIDLIARDGQTVVFIEVKARSGTGFGDPLESITTAKARKLHELALAWLVDQDEGVHSVRIDAIGVMVRPGAEPDVTHVRGIR